MKISLTLRRLSVTVGLNHPEGKGSASKFILLATDFFEILIIFLNLFLSASVCSYSESDYFKQTMRQGAPSKPKEPRIPRMPHL